MIGPSIVIKGTVSGDEDLLVQGRVEGSIGTACFSDHCFDLRDGCYGHVEQAQVFDVFLHPRMGHGGRHQQKRTFVQCGHELFASVLIHQKTLINDERNK